MLRIETLGNGSSVEFVELDGSVMDKQRILEIVKAYEKVDLWPESHTTKIVSFEERASILDYILSQLMCSGDVLGDFLKGPSYYIKKDLSIIGLPTDHDYNETNFDRHIITHIPKIFSDPDGIIDYPDLNTRFIKGRDELNQMHLFDSVSKIIFNINDYVATSLFPGDKTLVRPNQNYYTKLVEQEKENIVNTRFTDTIIASDLSLAYLYNQELDQIIDNTTLPEKKKEKLKLYSRDLGNSINKTIGGIKHPTREHYTDALLGAMDQFNVYESCWKNPYKKVKFICTIPELNFSKIDGIEYSIETLGKKLTDENFLQKKTIKALESRVKSIKTPLYINENKS